MQGNSDNLKKAAKARMYHGQTLAAVHAEMADKKSVAERKAKAKKKPVKHSAAHPGFQSVQKNIAKKQGISKDSAGAILASAARHASGHAKKVNPRLKRVN